MRTIELNQNVPYMGCPFWTFNPKAALLANYIVIAHQKYAPVLGYRFFEKAYLLDKWLLGQENKKENVYIAISPFGYRYQEKDVYDKIINNFLTRERPRGMKIDDYVMSCCSEE